MSSEVPALPIGQVWVAASLGGYRVHVANMHAQRAHCGKLLVLPKSALEQAVDAPEELTDVCRRCAGRIMPLAIALGLV